MLTRILRDRDPGDLHPDAFLCNYFLCRAFGVHFVLHNPLWGLLPAFAMETLRSGSFSWLVVARLQRQGGELSTAGPSIPGWGGGGTCLPQTLLYVVGTI